MKLSLIAKNFTALLGSNFAVQALRFLTIVILARRLGTQVFGVYNYILLLVGIGFPLTEFGLKNLAIREISQGKGSRHFVGQIFRVRILLAIVSCLGLGIAMKFAFPAGTYALPALLISLSLLADAFLADFLLISRERLVSQAVGNVLQAGVLCVGSFIFVHSSLDFPGLSLIFLTSHIIWIGLFWISARDIKASLPMRSEVDGNLMKISAGGVPFLIAQFVGSIQLGMDLLLLGQFHFESWLGDYSAALKIIGVMVGVISSLMAAVQPRLAKYTHDFKSSEMKALIFNTTRLVWLIVVPSVIGCWLLSGSLVNWFFGDKFHLASGLLRPLSVSLSLFCLGLAPMHALFVAKKGKILIRIALSNCLVSFATVSILLVLKHPELVAWGMIFVQFVYLTSGWNLFQYRGLVTREDLNLLGAPALAMVLVMSIPGEPPLLKLILGSVAYLGGLWMGRVWQRPWFKEVLS